MNTKTLKFALLVGLISVHTFTFAFLGPDFFITRGEQCPAGAIHMSISETEGSRDEVCKKMASNQTLRIGSLAKVVKTGSSCAIQLNRTEINSGDSLCKHIYSGSGESCPLFKQHISLAEARDGTRGDTNNLCNFLRPGQISRLTAKSSMENTGNGCSILANDSRRLGSSLCQANMAAGSLDGRSQTKMAYVGVNENDFENISCYQEEDRPLFNVASIFAANINYDETTKKAALYFNPQVSKLLDNELSKVKNVQAQGTKVVLSILGNRQNAGWSCFAKDDDARDFANQLKGAVDKYGLDGIDIDDEYSNCTVNLTSIHTVTKMMREIMPGKLVTKALFRDVRDFQTPSQPGYLKNTLDYGWELSYFSADSCTTRLKPYLDAGVSKSKLGVGAWQAETPVKTGRDLAKCAIDNGLTGGMMIFDVKANSLGYLQSIWRGVSAKPGCLK